MVRLRNALGGLIVLACTPCGGGGDSEVESTSLVPSGSEALRGSYSPDGEYLAFLGNRTDAPSPDGRIVVVSGNSDRDITPKDASVDGYGWMPDSRSVLVASSRDGEDGSRLAIVDIEGEGARPLALAKPMLIVGNLAPLPGGRKAVVAAQEPSESSEYTDLYELDLESGALRRLTMTDQVAEDEPALIDADRLAFNGGLLADDFGGPNGWVGVLTLATGEVRRLTPESQTAGTPAVSPDGGTIVYPRATRAGLEVEAASPDLERLARSRPSRRAPGVGLAGSPL